VRWIALACLASLWLTATPALSADWFYLDDGSDQGTAWRDPNFPGVWASGPQQLGYGDDDVVTTVSFGGDPNHKHITTYFRREFEVPDRGSVVSVELELVRDDGAIVYLNGLEVFRSNMPGGAIDYQTEASSTLGDSQESIVHFQSVSPTLLLEGTNTLAAEVHQGDPASSDISFELDVVLELPVLLRGPYLQQADPNGIVVRFATDVSTLGHVRYGNDPNDLPNLVIGPDTASHEIALTGLAPNTTYYYAIGDAFSDFVGHDLDHRFHTPPDPGTRGKTRIWAIGDSGWAGAAVSDMRDDYVAFTGSERTDVWLMLGDNAYLDGTLQEYQASVFDIFPSILRDTVLWPVFGNHDAVSSSSPSETGPYFDLFTMPRAGESGGLASGTEAYYSFDHANIHFVVLDSEGDLFGDVSAHLNPAGTMLTWLAADLATTTQEWIIVAFHSPPYSKGTHDSDSFSDSGGRLALMRQNALPIMEAAGVDLVLAGHSHNYERSMLIDGHYGLSGTFSLGVHALDSGDGCICQGACTACLLGGDGPYVKQSAAPTGHEGSVYAVVGSSSLAGSPPLGHPVMIAEYALVGSLVLDVEGSRLDGTWIERGGALLDSFTILKGADTDGDFIANPDDLDDDGDGLPDHVENDTGVFLDPNHTGTDPLVVDTDGDGVNDFDEVVGGSDPTDPSDPIPTWFYLDDGSDQGTAWRDPNAPGTWASGLQQLGYGDNDVVTTVSFGGDPNDKHITTYFRREFEVADPQNAGIVGIGLVRDDGAIVYLNGIEVFRSNMPAGAIDFQTLASSTVGSVNESSVHFQTLSPTLLLEGTNTLAAEIHQAEATSSDLSFELDIVLGAVPALLRGPYLQQADPNGVIVRFATDFSNTGHVRYGTDPNDLPNLVLGDDTPSHEILLTGLDTNTTYYYAIGDTFGDFAGHDPNYRFHTPPVFGARGKTRVWVIGDSGEANQAARDVRDDYVAFTGNERTDMWLMLGDNAYPDGTLQEYQDAVFDIYPGILRNTVLSPVFGNHDAVSASSTGETGVYFDLFTMPRAGESGGLASGTEAYYSFDHANIHFVVLDSQGGGDVDAYLDPNGTMLTWLAADLAMTSQEWIIVAFHHPPYTKGALDSDNSAASGGRMTKMRQKALPIMEAAGVDLVLAGHSHSYERSMLIDGHYGVSGTFDPQLHALDGGDGCICQGACTACLLGGDGPYVKQSPFPTGNEGSVYAVVGSSSSAGGLPFGHPIMIAEYALIGSLVLDVEGSRLDGTWIERGGALLDSFTILKGGDTDGDFIANPDDADDDGDGLPDWVENDTGFFVDPNHTGTDPLVVDTDHDGISDFDEVVGGSDPTDPSDPIAAPTTGPLQRMLLSLGLLGVLALALIRARPGR